MSNQVKIISHLNQIHDIEGTWCEVYNSTRNASSFLSFEYILLWYNCFADPKQVRIYSIEDEGRIIGYLPFVYKKEGLFKILSSLTNDHCLHAGALIRKGYEEIFFTRYIETLNSDKFNWDVLYSHGGYSFGPGLGFKNLPICKQHVKEQVAPTYTILLPKSFSEYFNLQLSAKMRKNAKSEKNRLKKVSSYRFLHYTGEEARDHWSTFLEIEDSGWKGEQGSSIKRQSKNYQIYYENLVSLLSSKDKLHMYLMEVEDMPISGAFCYVDQNVFHYAKIGYLEEFSSLSPSNLLLMFIIEDIITNLPSVSRFHMFPWDYGYKHRYINEDSCFSEISIYSPTIRGECAYYLSSGKEKLKHIPGLVSFVDILRRNTKKG